MLPAKTGETVMIKDDDAALLDPILNYEVPDHPPNPVLTLLQQNMDIESPEPSDHLIDSSGMAMDPKLYYRVLEHLPHPYLRLLRPSDEGEWEKSEHQLSQGTDLRSDPSPLNTDTSKDSPSPKQDSSFTGNESLELRQDCDRSNQKNNQYKSKYRHPWNEHNWASLDVVQVNENSISPQCFSQAVEDQQSPQDADHMLEDKHLPQDVAQELGDKLTLLDHEMEDTEMPHGHRQLVEDGFLTQIIDVAHGDQRLPQDDVEQIVEKELQEAVGLMAEDRHAPQDVDQFFGDSSLPEEVSDSVTQSKVLQSSHQNENSQSSKNVGQLPGDDQLFQDVNEMIPNHEVPQDMQLNEKNSLPQEVNQADKGIESPSSDQMIKNKSSTDDGELDRMNQPADESLDSVINEGHQLVVPGDWEQPDQSSTALLNFLANANWPLRSDQTGDYDGEPPFLSRAVTEGSLSNHSSEGREGKVKDSVSDQASRGAPSSKNGSERGEVGQKPEKEEGFTSPPSLTRDLTSNRQTSHDGTATLGELESLQESSFKPSKRIESSLTHSETSAKSARETAVKLTDSQNLSVEEKSVSGPSSEQMSDMKPRLLRVGDGLVMISKSGVKRVKSRSEKWPWNKQDRANYERESAKVQAGGHPEEECTNLDCICEHPLTDVKIGVDTAPSQEISQADQLERFPDPNFFFKERNKEGEWMPIDCVLVYTSNDSPKNEMERKLYEKNLNLQGLKLEREQSKDSSLVAVKVHAPWSVLTYHAEMMKIRKSFKRNAKNLSTGDERPASACLSRWWKWLNPFSLDEEYNEIKNDHAVPFRRAQESMISAEERQFFFTRAERSQIVCELLQTTPGKEGHTNGLHSLLNAGVYNAAFPLHEAPSGSRTSVVDQRNESHRSGNGKNRSDRSLLLYLWAQPRRWYKYQPLRLINRYFGEKVAVYFSWLGFYTTMLIPMALLGLFVFIASFLTLDTDTTSNDVCNKSGAGNLTMCPQCDRTCTYSKLSDSCLNTKLSYLMYNSMNISFTVAMLIWAKLYLLLWRRCQASRFRPWDVHMGATAPRPCQEMPANGVESVIHSNLWQTRQIPSFPRYVVALFTVIFLLCNVAVFAASIIIYQLSSHSIYLLFQWIYSMEEFTGGLRLVCSSCSAFLNMLFVLILNRIYHFIAVFITNFELTRSEKDFERSLIFKAYCLQFCNYYGSVIYIAFLKGSFIGRPDNYWYIGDHRTEECDHTGCLMDLCINLLFIFVGGQLVELLKEVFTYGCQVLCRCDKLRKLRATRVPLYKIAIRIPFYKKNRHTLSTNIPASEKDRAIPQWEVDFSLQSNSHQYFIREYISIVIQFGFITLFVSAFPLAPLFALFSNIIEIRLDAFKMLTQWRRPYATRAEDIGVWYNILNSIIILAVLTNALIIGYTSDDIPKLFYSQIYGKTEGFFSFYYSVFNTSDFEERSVPLSIPHKFGDSVGTCWYRGFRKPYSDPHKYAYTATFWHVVLARFAFIVIFEHCLLFAISFLSWLIDAPESGRKHMKVELDRAIAEGDEVNMKPSQRDHQQPCDWLRLFYENEKTQIV